eukprot:scaffold398_cov206-Pinguiococcus_pyrenoidosus.AAC.3
MGPRNIEVPKNSALLDGRMNWFYDVTIDVQARRTTGVAVQLSGPQIDAILASMKNETLNRHVTLHLHFYSPSWKKSFLDYHFKVWLSVEFALALLAFVVSWSTL